METQEILQGIHDWTNGKIVYDISVAHPDGQGNPTPYADLAAALGVDGANIPEGLRKGGMSVKFVHSSDNNYVQFRYTGTEVTGNPNPFLDTDNWTSGDGEFSTGEKVSEIGIDDEPTPESENLVKSGGVYDNYARQDGYYETLGVGEAKNIIGQIPQDAGFIYRTAGGNSEIADGLSHVKKIQGNVVSWNQLLKEGYLVDMGLPSGTLWASRNIDVTQPDGFAASPFQYGCSFFSWGNVDGHNPISASAFDYDFGAENAAAPWFEGQPYGETQGCTLQTDIPVGDTYDAARVNCGSLWRIPTHSEVIELLNNVIYINADGTEVETSDKQVLVNGIVGVYMESKINGNRLFLPSTGRAKNNSLLFQESEGVYWLSKHSSAKDAGTWGSSISGVSHITMQVRNRGFAVRPVMSKSTSIGNGKGGHKFALTSNGKNITDVTITYGTGNEPSSVAQFEADYQRWFGKPLDYEPYNEGTLIPMKMQGIKTVGFNQYNPTTGIVKGLVVDGGYQITGTYTSITQDGVEITPNANGIFTIEKAGDIVVNGGDETTCVHFVYDGHRNGEYEPYKEHNYDFDVTRVWGKLNGEGSYVQIAPEGLRSATSINSSSDLQNAIADLIEFGEDGVTADVKVGKVDLGDLEWISQLSGFVAYLNPTPAKLYKAIAPKFPFVGKYTNINQDKETGYVYATRLFIKYDSTTNVNVLKSEIQGVPFYYQLAAPLHYTDLMLDTSVAGDGSQLEPITNVRPIVDNYGTEEIKVPSSQDDTPTSCNPWMSIQYDINAAEHIDTFEKHGIKDVALHDNLQALCSVINTNCSEQLGGTIAISAEPNDSLVYNFTFTANAQTQSVAPQSETI